MSIVRVLMLIVLLVAVSVEVPEVAQGQDRPQVPLFRSATVLVEVDVIVKDRSGRFVSDLRRDELEILENGVPQQVETFFVVGGPPPATEVGAVRGKTAGQAASRAQAASPLPAEQARRVFVLFFDLEHCTPAAVERAKSAAVAFLREHFQTGDVGGVVAGGRMINSRLTSVREELVAAVQSVQPQDDSRARVLYQREWPRLEDLFEAYRISLGDRELLQRAVQRACNDDIDACRKIAVDQYVREKANRMVAEGRASALRTLTALSALMNGLERLPGRKTVILLSDGFFTEDNWADLRGVIGRAARATVRIYSLDTRGLNRGSASSGIIDAPPGGGTAFSAPGFDSVANGPNSLAVDTGGLAIRNTNNFVQALDEIDRDTSSYYVLGYRPAHAALDGTFREITVRVKRPGVTVRARRGYVAAARPPEAQSDRAAADKAAEAPPGKAANVPAPATTVPQTVADPEARDAGALAVRLKPLAAEQVAALGGGPTGRGSEASRETLEHAKAGWEAYQRGDVTTARNQLAAAAADSAAPLWVHYVLGFSEFALGEHGSAAERWERVRDGAVTFKPVYFDLADAYFQDREFGKAVAVLRAAEDRWPADVDVFNALGVIQAARGALDDAVRTFEKAVAVAPGDANACFNLARASEIRYVRAQRLGQTAPGTPAERLDRERALEYYRRTVELGGPLAESAREGIKRLGG